MLAESGVACAATALVEKVTSLSPPPPPIFAETDDSKSALLKNNPSLSTALLLKYLATGSPLSRFFFLRRGCYDNLSLLMESPDLITGLGDVLIYFGGGGGGCISN